MRKRDSHLYPPFKQQQHCTEYIAQQAFESKVQWLRAVVVSICISTSLEVYGVSVLSIVSKNRETPKSGRRERKLEGWHLNGGMTRFNHRRLRHHHQRRHTSIVILPTNTTFYVTCSKLTCVILSFETGKTR